MLFIHSEIERSSIQESDGRWSSIEVKHTCKITLGFILHHSLHRFLSFVDIHTYVPIEKGNYATRPHIGQCSFMCRVRVRVFHTRWFWREKQMQIYFTPSPSFPVAFVFMFGTKASEHRTIWWDSTWNLLAKWMQIRAEREKKNISRLSRPDVQCKCQRTTYPWLNKR